MTLDLRRHFSEFRNAQPGRIHLAAHSHHYWPDAACTAHRRALADAARLADRKWEFVFGELMPRVQRGVAAILGLPDPASVAFAPNTHDLVRRLLSALPANSRARILTSDSEFHSFTRQIERLEEDGLVSVERIAAEPFATFADRFAAAARRGAHDVVYVSQVFYNSAATCGALDAIVAAVPNRETLVVFDGYHGFMALPTDFAPNAARAFYLAGGYKYAMAGENACFMHCPPGYAMRPRDTGWFAAFGALSREGNGEIAYGADGSRFLGATFDPAGLYRLAAVFDWMDEIKLSIAAIHAHALALQDLFLAAIARAKLQPLCAARLVTPTGTAPRGNFLTFELDEAKAVHDRLMRAGIVTDMRGKRLRIGFGCYHAAEDIEPAVAAVARALA
ncbi:MAG TPA: aminotransferase class V-fold PLP-dependent enzyme [Xanthobacteraceae bacterium]|nr:aminotransferase class V-fold PLP-dependent enzyme [Xanthobacteraceae bacterium]